MTKLELHEIDFGKVPAVKNALEEIPELMEGIGLVML